MSKPSCPDRSRLADYRLGKVSFGESETIANHLEACTACGSTIEELDRDDPLAAELRNASREGDLPEEPQLKAVLAGLHALPNDSAEPARLPNAADLPAGKQIGAYRIGRVLGRGGMGVVYQAWHTQLDRVVALKALPQDRDALPEATARFRREMKAVGRLNDPRLVTAYDAGDADGVLYLAMELVEGFDLRHVVDRLGALPIADACELIRQAAEGLDYASRHGVVHRDVKASNLMLTSAGAVKVLDLGLARLVDRPPQDEISRTGEVLGTLNYMAPEQITATDDIDARVDVYGLGATLYKLLTGHAPYSEPRYGATIAKLTAILQEPLTPAQRCRAEIPDRLAELLDRLLAKDRERRLATPGEVVEAIAPFAAGSDLQSLYNRAQSAESSRVGDQAIALVDSPRGSSSLATSSTCAACQEPARGRWTRPAAVVGTILAGSALILIATALLSPWKNRSGLGPKDAASTALPAKSPTAASAEPPSALLNTSPVRLTLIESDSAPPAGLEPAASRGPAVAAPPSGNAKPAAASVSVVYPIAVLPFADRSTDLRLAAQVTDVVTARLGGEAGLSLVERAEIDRLLAEQRLNLSGAVTAAEAVRIGQLAGAKLLVSGSVAQLDKSVLLSAKIIATESGRVIVASVSGTASDDLGALAGKLADRVVELLGQRAGELVPKIASRPDRVAMLKKQLGPAKRPTLWIHVSERHVGQPTIDPAAQTELMRLCRETGFEVFDTPEGGQKRADILVEGEAFSELAGRHAELVSVKARVEVKAVERQTGRVLVAERQTEVVVDLAEHVAGKSALQQAAAAIAERMLTKLVGR